MVADNIPDQKAETAAELESYFSDGVRVVKHHSKDADVAIANRASADSRHSEQMLQAIADEVDGVEFISTEMNGSLALFDIADDVPFEAYANEKGFGTGNEITNSVRDLYTITSSTFLPSEIRTIVEDDDIALRKVEEYDGGVRIHVVDDRET